MARDRKKNEGKLKAVVFDNEGVLVMNSWDRVSQLAARFYSGEPLPGNQFKDSLRFSWSGGKDALADYSGGRMSGEIFWNGVLEKYGVPKNTANVEGMKEAMRQLTTDVDKDAVEFVRRLKEHGQHRVYLLSNSNPEIHEGNRSRNDYFDLFDRCYFSFQMGSRKPEKNAYLQILGDNHLEGTECLLVEDTEKNADAAVALGMQVLRHRIGDGKLSERLSYLLEEGK